MLRQRRLEGRATADSEVTFAVSESAGTLSSPMSRPSPPWLFSYTVPAEELKENEQLDIPAHAQVDEPFHQRLRDSISHQNSCYFASRSSRAALASGCWSLRFVTLGTSNIELLSFNALVVSQDDTVSIPAFSLH